MNIPEPIDSITTEKVFSTAANANAAVAGVYYKMNNISNNINPAFNGKLTLYPALSADEINVAEGPELYYQNNSLLSDDDQFWGSIYNVIYSANAVIEGLQASKNLTTAVKDQYTGEVKFIRAFCFFYLANLFGDVPLVTSTDFATNSFLAQVPTDQVYKQVVSDLEDAKSKLGNDYAMAGGERIRVNKYGASALLARVYLYMGKWAEAENEANIVIGNVAAYKLLSDLNQVFTKNNGEAILQLQTSEFEPFAAFEGFQFVPEYLTKDYPADVIEQNWQYFVPKYYLTSQLVGAFDDGDKRKQSWLDSTGSLNGVNYYYPYKYKVRRAAAGGVSEYNNLLRLAEQYLIRAEARARRNNLSGAIGDLNIIRNRAGLPNLTSSLSSDEVLVAVAKENRVEFCFEWGHRWFDLKRTKMSGKVLGPIKGSNWQETDQLYPVPKAELLLNPKLKQNEGYQ